MTIKNPFSDEKMRKLFDGYVSLFYEGKMRNPDGTPNHGGASRCMFWRGYDGTPNLLAPKGSPNYAAFRAGQAVKRVVKEHIEVQTRKVVRR